VPDQYREITPRLQGRVLGRKLLGDYAEYLEQLQPDEVLYFVHYRGIDEVIVSPVRSEDEFQVELNAHQSGFSSSYKLVAALPPRPMSGAMVIINPDDDGPVFLFG
jgi:hypothetical protein